MQNIQKITEVAKTAKKTIEFIADSDLTGGNKEALDAAIKNAKKLLEERIVKNNVDDSDIAKLAYMLGVIEGVNIISTGHDLLEKQGIIKSIEDCTDEQSRMVLAVIVGESGIRGATSEIVFELANKIKNDNEN
jgi:hypothetical protein